MDFQSPDVFAKLSPMSAQELDQLPFGVVKMDTEGTIKSYNKFESEFAGLSQDYALNKHFFTQVAPCTNNFMVAGKFDQGEVDETIDYVFTYRMKPTPVKLRLLKQEAAATQYLLVEVKA